VSSDGTSEEVSSEALEKMDKVMGLLAREDRWGRQQLRYYGGRYCIEGAMMEANAATLREPIPIAIKQVTGRNCYPKIEAFNDYPSTSHDLVLRVLHQARDNIRSGEVESPPATPARPRLASWARLRLLFA
jgi:hypothetical protein